MYKQDLAFNNQEWLISIKPNQTLTKCSRLKKYLDTN